MSTIQIAEGSAIPPGPYYVKAYNGARADVIKKVLTNYEHRTETYRYCLFKLRQGGYAVRRKNRLEPEQEQSWEDVAEVFKELVAT